MSDNKTGLLTYEDLVHPLIKNRIVLDYPLDVLLNRGCLLQDYEHRIIRALQEYNTERDRFWIWYKSLGKEEQAALLFAILKILRLLMPENSTASKNDTFTDNDFVNTIRHYIVKDKDEDAAGDAVKKIISNLINFDTINSTKEEIRKNRNTIEGILSCFSKYSETIAAKEDGCICNLKKCAQENLKDSLPNEGKGIVFSFLKQYFNVYKKPKGKIGSLIIRNVKGEYDPMAEKDFPGTEEIGSGNILIKGRPGSGKSTLALQMAVACTYGPNHYSSVYISFEEPIKNIMLKARAFNWEEKLCQVQFLNDVDEFSSPEEIGNVLEHMLTQPESCKFRGNPENNDACNAHTNKKKESNDIIEPQVLLPLLSPRSLSHEVESQDDLFWERYKQLERLLTGIEAMRNNGHKRIPDIRMVCIDSLNVFGGKPLTRTELFKLFDLFKVKGVIGVFTAEQESKTTAFPVGEQIEDYLADTIINLHMEDDNGYANRYFEVTKSRYQHQVYGLHPMRLRGMETETIFRKQWFNADEVSKNIADDLTGTNVDRMFENIFNHINDLKFSDQKSGVTGNADDELKNNYLLKIKAFYFSRLVHSSGYFDEKNEGKIKDHIQNILTTRHTFFQPVTIHPSLHYVVYSTEMQSLSEDSKNGGKSFCIGSEKLQSYIKHDVKENTNGSVVTICGPRATFKTIIAQNFLLDGIRKNEHVLLITLGEQSSVKLEGKKLDWLEINDPGKNGDLEFTEQAIRSLNDPKRIMRVYNSNSGCCLTELTLKGGALLPEELLEFVRDIFREYHHGEKRIARVVLDDVARMGPSYPFLRHSKTSGDLFLPALVHIMKNYKVNLLITGTTGQMPESDEMVNRACELADSVLTCEFCDVFGDRYVTISGDGMHSISNETTGDYVPAVVRVKKTSDKDETKIGGYFEIDTQILQGLVGFGTPHIYRPGLRLYTFKEGEILNAYNKELQAMLSSSLGISWQEPFDDSSGNAEEQKPGKDAITFSPLKKQDISVVSFNSGMSSALHDSLDIIKNEPIDSTVVYTIDEFWLCPDDPNDSNCEKNQIQQSFCELGEIKEKSDKNVKDCYKAKEFKQVVPYYGNVLMVAYRNDISFSFVSKIFDDGDKKRERMQWKNVQNYKNAFCIEMDKTYKDNQVVDLDHCGIDFTGVLTPWLVDSSAPETISCIMLDIFSKEIFNDERTIKTNISFNADKFIDDFINLQQLMTDSSKDKKAIEKSDIFKKKLKPNTLHPYAGVYICWYSQLREMIAAYPYLAKKLNVCALPGGGIQGDWYLGVAKGSVSVELGKRVINILTSKKEQYKRFALGVGLPTLNCFYNTKEELSGEELNPNFFAWPSSPEDVTFKTISDIHDNAHSRRLLPGYKEFKTMLYTIGKQLIAEDQCKQDEQVDVKDLVKRIHAQYMLLKENADPDKPDNK